MRMSEACPQCGVQMVVLAATRTNSRTRDHILPKFRGGTLKMLDDVRNVRIMCSGCNNLVAQCGQCLGALACARTVAKEQGISVWAMLRQWKFGRIVTAMLARDWARVEAENRAARAEVLALERRATFGDLMGSRA